MKNELYCILLEQFIDDLDIEIANLGQYFDDKDRIDVKLFKPGNFMLDYKLVTVENGGNFKQLSRLIDLRDRVINIYAKLSDNDYNASSHYHPNIDSMPEKQEIDNDN